MGRLIDADALIKKFQSDKEYFDKVGDTTFAMATIGVINDIEDAPTIEVPKWIPCEERLPEKGEHLVTWGDIGDGIVDIAYYGKPTNPTREVNGLCFYDYNDEYGDIPYSTVIAWMPLPKPYEESEK